MQAFRASVRVSIIGDPFHKQLSGNEASVPRPVPPPPAFLPGYSWRRWTTWPENLKNYEEKIWPNAGHGVMMYFHTDEYLKAIKNVLEK